MQFLMFASSSSFSTKAASLSKMASLLWHLTQDLNLLGLFERNTGLTTKFAVVKVSENNKDEPLLKTRVNMTQHKKQNTS